MVTVKKRIPVRFVVSFAPAAAPSLGNVRQLTLYLNSKGNLDMQSTKKKSEPANGLLVATIEPSGLPVEKT